MNSNNRGGRGTGQGRGQGGSRAAGIGGNCVCTKCGHSEPHERGVPCMQKKCPQCGTILIRK